MRDGFGSQRVTTLALVIVLLLVGNIAIASAQQWPTPSGWVNDYAGLLSPGEKTELERIIGAIEAERGVEISVVALSETGDYSPKEYAVELFERWSIGKKGIDNGLLILIAVDARRIEVEVGYGLEGILPDGRVGELLDRYFIPEARNGRLGAGVLALVKQLQPIVTGETEPYTTKATAGLADPFLLGIILFVLVVLVGSLLAITRLSQSGAKCPQCGHRLSIERTVLREPTETTDGAQTVTYSCPGCKYHRITEVVLPAVVTATAIPPIVIGHGRGPRRGGGGHGGFGGFGGFGGGRSGGGGAGRGW